MADRKLTQLPDVALPLDGTELMYIVKSNSSDKATLAALRAFVIKDLAVGVTYPMKVPDGTKAEPSIGHKDDVDTGIYFPQTGRINFSTNSEDALRIDDGDVIPKAFFIPTVTTVPTGAPHVHANYSNIVLNIADRKLYFYANGAWNTSGGAGGDGDTTYQLPWATVAPLLSPTTTIERVIAANFGTLFPGKTPARNDIIVVSGAVGADAANNGSYVIIEHATLASTWVVIKIAKDPSQFTFLPTRATAAPATNTLGVGHMVFTTENGHKALAVVDSAGNLVTLFDDDELNARIAANSLFQGVVSDDAGLSGLPAPSNSNRGFYWTWQGASNHAIDPANVTGSIVDATNGLSGQALNGGDWLQISGDGKSWIHVSSDLLSKARWQNLGSFSVWSAGTYESGALVMYRAAATDPIRYYRSTGNVLATDSAPGTAGAPWTDITPGVKLAQVSGIDVATTAPTAGQTLIFDGTNFVNNNIVRSIIYIGNGVYNVVNILSAPDRFGMPAGTVPDPQVTRPFPGDMYIDLQTGKQTLFTGAGGTTEPPVGGARTASTITGAVTAGGSLFDSLSKLQDVDMATSPPSDKQALVWDQTKAKWIPGQGGMFLGSVANRPTGTFIAGATYYQTAAETITTTTPATTPAGIVAPTPTYDPLMNTPLQAGAVPDPASPGDPWRNPTVVSIPSVEPKYRFIYNGVTYQVDGAAPLIARIAAGEATPDLWAAGVNPPISASTVTPGSTATTNVGVGFYRWDGTAWQTISTSQPMVYYGAGAFDAANVTAPLFGMAANTVPDPNTWVPAAGDLYIDTATGIITLLTGGGATPASPTGNRSDTVTGGTTTTVDVSGDYIPLFKGTFSVGSNTGSGYAPPTTPAEGDIWVDKNSTPPVFKVYRNGAWVLVNWQTDHLGLLSDLANVNVGASGSPGQGDALIFNQLTEQWESGAVPAHIAEYDRNTNYSAGTTVYFKGGLFEAKARTSGTSPEFNYGDVWFYHRALFTGKGDWVGPVSFEAVNVVVDETVAPLTTFAGDDLRPHWTFQYVDDAHWSIWQWDLSMAGWTPGSALPVAQWHRYDTKFTRPGMAKLWRNYSTPPSSVGDVVPWIYDDPKGTNRPHYRDFPWLLRPIRSDLVSMHDVKAENPADKSMLIWNTSTSYWEAKPNPSYTKAEADAKIQSLIQGLSHGTAVQAIQNDPPAAPVVDEFYIVGTAGTGAWAGHNNAIAWWDGAAWQFQTPQTGETRLVETAGSGGENWHWNGTAWVKVGNATSMNIKKMSQADYNALATKDPATLYLITAT